MYFKKLDMHGFKSFAEPVSIEFHEGVTCIVGPNGSGKSNISDAIRWVLGEQSPKMLRGGKMDEVIFAGTENRKSRGMAEVTLVIDNSNGILPIDYNEVAITRRMFRSGESEYLINNNQCRLKDIRELIMDTGIGVDGYSIIGQGKISDIVSNKPESRREIFEEAAGVVLYKSKKNEAEKKLDATQGNLERVNDIIGEIEGRIDGLREDSIKAKEYLKLKDRYQELEINITLKNIDSLDLKIEQMKDDITELGISIDEMRDRKSKLDSSLTTDREQSSNLQQLGNEAREKLLAKVEEINQLTNQDQLNSERLSTIERDINRIKEEIKELLDKSNQESGNKAELDKSIDSINLEIEHTNEKLASSIDYYNEINQKAINLLEAIDNGKNRLFVLHGEISSQNSEARSIENLKESLKKRENQIKEEQDKLQSNGSRLAKELEQEDANLSELNNELERIKETIDEDTKKQSEYKAKELLIRKAIDDIRIQSGQVNSRKKTIEEMENNYEGYNYAVKYIMKSGMKGLDGVIAELMTVPQGLEVAIETALGGALQNVVCHDDSCAKAAVESLKTNKAGRLTFLPISSIRSKKTEVPSQIANAQGFKGTAVDCISFDKKYEGVFQYLLGRVAIVDNMDNAVKLSKMSGSGLRFVTLEGEIINVSGAITGGKYKNKTANFLERKGEITALANQLEELKKQYNAKNKEFEDNSSLIHDLVESIDEQLVEKNSLEISIATCQSRLSSLKNENQEFASNGSKYANEIASIKGDYDKADQMIADIKSASLKADDEIKALNQSIEDNMVEYDEVKKDVEHASEEITNVRIENTELINKREGVANILDRVNNTIEDYKIQIEVKDEKIESLKGEKTNILFGSDDAENLVKENTEEKARLEDYIKQVGEESYELSEKIKKDSEEQTSLDGQLTALSDQKYELEIKRAKNETQLETHKEKLWEEFEVSYIQAMDFKKKDFVMSTALKETRTIKNRIKELGDVNVGSIKEYETVGERYEFLTAQREDIEKAMGELQSIIGDMETTIKAKFKENFDQVVVNFESIFKELFGGGHAELRLEGSDNPLEAGIEIIAQPPGKKLQNINLMSGGEKTMTAIALMFAVLKTKPTPFCILDEVEAALDDPNIDRFSNYLKKFNEIQFALITHQKATMEHADVLYGVTMPEQGISKVLSLKLEDNFELD